MVEILALATLHHGVSAVIGDGRVVRTAIANAWIAWRCSSRWPDLDAFTISWMVWEAMSTQSHERCRRAKWSGISWIEAQCTTIGWSIEESLSALVSDEVSVESWLEFGALFLSGFRESEVERVAARVS